MKKEQGLSSEVVKIAKEIENLKKRKVGLLRKLQKECPHPEVLTTSYVNDFYTEGAYLCTHCGLHAGALDGDTPASWILTKLPKTVKKILNNDEFQNQREKVFKKFGIS